MCLYKIFKDIERIRKSINKNSESNLNWKDYEFGKNFCLSVKRDKKQTEKEINFIIKNLRLRDDSKILDLGCGDGRISIELSKKGYSVTGVDLNKYAIEKAISESKNLNINFINENILNFKSKEKFSDILIIFNHFGLFNKKDVNRLIRNISNYLEDGGRIIIETNSINYGKNIDGIQEWKIYENWLGGNYPQLVLSENYFFPKNIYIRKDYSIGINNFVFKEFLQKLYLYDIEEIDIVLKQNNLKLEQVYSNWEGDIFQDDDENIILIAKK
jgi:2-polyprenyl-3-methyl-5-hydroxy-6-metoxy-1,4-benzoquinol methylase